MIYFIGAKGTDLIKIGFTAGDPKARMRDLQTASPHRLVLMASIPGGEEQEAEWHEKFAADRTTGEWFRLTPTLLCGIVQACVHDRQAALERKVSDLLRDHQSRLDAIEDAVVEIESHLAPSGFRPATTHEAEPEPRPPEVCGPASTFGLGFIVQHDDYGIGHISQIVADKIHVRFPAYGEKIFLADKVRLRVVRGARA